MPNGDDQKDPLGILGDQPKPKDPLGILGNQTSQKKSSGGLNWLQATQSGSDAQYQLENDPVKSVLQPLRDKKQKSLEDLNSNKSNIGGYEGSPHFTFSPSIDQKDNFNIASKDLENKSQDIYNNFFKTTKEAKQYLIDNIDSGQNPYKNETIQLAIQKVNNRNQIDELAANSTSIEDMAGKVYGKDFSQASEAEKGQMLNNLLDLPEVKEKADEGGQFLHDYNVAKGTLFSKYPSFAIKQTGQLIGQKLEDARLTGWLYSNPDEKTLDKAVKMLQDEGKISPQELNVYQSVIRPAAEHGNVHKYIETKDIAHQFGYGLYQGAKGFEASGRDIVNKLGGGFLDPNGNSIFQNLGLMQKNEERTKEQEQQQASLPSVEAKRFATKYIGGAANFTGQFTPMILGHLVGIPEEANSVLMFEGNRVDEARQMFKGDAGKQNLYTLLGTTMDAFLMKAIPKGASDEVKGLISKDIGNVVTKLANKEITEDAAKQTILNNIPKYLGKLGVKNLETAGILSGYELANNGLNAAFGQRNFKLEDELSSVVNNAKTNFFLGTFMNALGAKGAVDKTSGKIYREASENQDQYISAIKANNNLTDVQKQEAINNVNHLATVGNEIKNLSPEKKEQFLSASLKNKIAQEKLKNIPDKQLQEPIKQQIEKTELQQQAILQNKNPDEVKTDNEIKLERLEKDKELSDRKFEADRSKLDGRTPEDRPKIEKLEEDKKRADEDYERDKAKLQPQLTEQPLNAGKGEQPQAISSGEGEGLGGKEKVVTSGSEGKAQNISTEENQGTENSTRPFSQESPEKRELKLNERLAKVVDENPVLNPYDTVLKHFATGGKIHSSAIQEIYGNKRGKSVENERRARISLLDKNGKSIDQLAHSLWEENNRGEEGEREYTTQDYKDAIENVLGDYNSKSAMAKALVEMYDTDAAYEKYMEKTHGKEAIDIVENLSEDEINHILQLDADATKQKELEDYLDNLSKPTEVKEPPVTELKKDKQGAAEAEGQQKKQGIGEPPIEPLNEEGLPFGKSENTGIAHEVQTGRAYDVEAPAPERGKGVTVEEAIKHGKDLLAKGESPEKAAEEFKKDGKISYAALSLVRAKQSNLERATNKAIDEFGETSDKARNAVKEERDWYNNVVKPMQTEWSKVGVAQQGLEDIDTGTFAGLRRAKEKSTGKPLSEAESKIAKELSSKVSKLEKEVEDLKQKLTEALDKGVKTEKSRSIKLKGKELASKIRGFKSKGDVAHESLLGIPIAIYDGALETIATAVEGGAKLIDAIQKGIDELKSKGYLKDDKEAKEFSAHVSEMAYEDLFTKFVDKKDNKFSNEEAAAIWNYAKDEYLDKGKNFDEMISGVANDLGMKPKQIRDALTTPKGTREITDAMYKKQNERNMVIQRAKDWAQSDKSHPLVKFLKSIPRFFFAAKVFGHGTVGMITHSGINIYDPVEWKRYWPIFFKQFQFAYGKQANYEKAMQDLQNDPQFIFWKRNGLAVDPRERYDDYQFVTKIFNKMGKMGRWLTAGDRGFNALKVYRLERAKSLWKNLSASEKEDPDTPKRIAKLVNHSTGTTNLKVSEAAQTVFFAPNLELARWNKLVVDPAKAIKTLVDWKNASPSEKAAAKIVSKRAGRILATYFGALAVNQGLLSLSGSNQSINFFNPNQNDWLKFKAGGRTIDLTGGMVSLLRFLVNVSQIATTNKNQKDALYKNAGDYVGGKLSPFASTTKDVVTHHDFAGNTLPFFDDKPLHSWNKKLTIGEYLKQQQTPIPVSVFFTDMQKQMEDEGIPKATIGNFLQSLFIAGVVGAAGAHIGEEPKSKSTSTTTPNKPQLPKIEKPKLQTIKQ